tara:strand:+ start:639 stop:806 length:168 start_codon:yes stop_codon:yes gene_type:complete
MIISIPFVLVVGILIGAIRGVVDEVFGVCSGFRPPSGWCVLGLSKMTERDSLKPL